MKHLPLCIDLDGTLIKSDTLYEAFLLLIKQNPFCIFLCMVWLLKGKAHLKHEITSRVSLDYQTLPYHEELIAWLKKEHKKGRDIYLVTAANKKIAEGVAAVWPFFKGYFASDEKHNLAGSNKAKFLVEQFGDKGFDYAGNAQVDLKVWAKSNKAIVANAKPSLKSAAEKVTKVAEFFPQVSIALKVFLKAIRVHQYAKNALLFLPFILGHYFVQVGLLWTEVLGFVCFSLLASSVYLLNDLLDLPSDRQHQKKKHRALASGQMSILFGGSLTIVLFIAAWVIACFLPPAFQGILLIYYILTLSYSFYLKQLVLIDVFMLSALYTIRIVAGMALIDAEWSQWLMLFSLFFFTSLAFVKRYTELHGKMHKQQKVMGRGYHVEDMLIVKMLGVASGLMSVVIMSLYLSSPQAQALYTHPKVLFAVCPLLMYWLSFIWVKTTRGEMHDDPVVFAIKDKQTYILGAIVVVTALFAMMG